MLKRDAHVNLASPCGCSHKVASNQSVSDLNQRLELPGLASTLRQGFEFLLVVIVNHSLGAQTVILFYYRMGSTYTGH